MSNKKYQCSFDFEGKTYTGYVVSSTDIEPHFHWFVFDDRNVIAQYGDSIPFKIEDGKLLPQYHLTSPDFVAAVQTCVQRFLDGLLKESAVACDGYASTVRQTQGNKKLRMTKD